MRLPRLPCSTCTRRSRSRFRVEVGGRDCIGASSEPALPLFKNYIGCFYSCLFENSMALLIACDNTHKPWASSILPPRHFTILM